LEVLSVPKEGGFYFELGFVLAIYLAFIFVYFWAEGMFGFVVYQFSYVMIGILAALISAFLYVSGRRKQIAAFYIIFTVIGATFLVLSTLVTTPYVTTKRYSLGGQSVVGPINFTETFASHFNTTDSFHPWDMYLFMNFSMLRIRVFCTGKCILELVQSPSQSYEGPYTVVFSTVLWNMSNVSPTEPADFYWTPSGPYHETPGEVYPPSSYGHYLYDYWFSLSFENLENSSITVQGQLDTYLPLITGDEQVSTNLPIIDRNYSFLGIGFLVAAVAIEFGAWVRKNRQHPPSTQLDAPMGSD
jgi:hypothetical protein